MRNGEIFCKRPPIPASGRTIAGVDPVAISELKQAILRLTIRGIGVLISDLNVRETLSIVDRGYIMFSGAILAQGIAALDVPLSAGQTRRLQAGDKPRSVMGHA